MSETTTTTTETKTGFADQIANAQSSKTNPAPSMDFMPETIAGDTTPEATTTQEPRVEAPKKIRLGNREFNSESELQGYVSELESTKGKYEAVQNQFRPQPVQPVEEENLEDLIFTDTKRYTQLVEERALRKFEEKMTSTQRQQQIEQQFYSTYPDLKNARTLVQAVAARLSQDNSLAGKGESEQLSIVAQAARREVAAIRGESSATEELQSTTARVAGSSSGAPINTGVRATVPQNMVEQLKARAKARKPVNS